MRSYFAVNVCNQLTNIQYINKQTVYYVGWKWMLVLQVVLVKSHENIDIMSGDDVLLMVLGTHIGCAQWYVFRIVDDVGD